MAKATSLIPAERIERSILLLRGHKVMLDSDLAALFEVETNAPVEDTGGVLILAEPIAAFEFRKLADEDYDR